MKQLLAALLAFATLVGTSTSALASGIPPSAPSPAESEPRPPAMVIAEPTALSDTDIAHYRQRAAEVDPAFQDEAAGAFEEKTVWIVVGVVVLAVVILAASGGSSSY